MALFTDTRGRGCWILDNDKYQDWELYPSFCSDLRKILGVLLETRLFLPSMLDRSYPLDPTNIDELVNTIMNSYDLSKTIEIGLEGSTVIYTTMGEEVYDNVLYFEMRTWQQFITFYLSKDVFLPLAYNEDSPTLFEWNLDRYYLNKNRLKDMLDQLNAVLGWKNNSLGEIDNFRRGCMQYGHSLFLSEDFMRAEWEFNPNPNFNLEQYIQEMKEAEAAARAFQKG